MKRCLLTLCLILFALGTFAQTSIIKGQNESYANFLLQVKKYSEQFTYSEQLLGEIQTDQQGSFRIELDLKETQLVFLPLGIYKGFLFVEPGKEYEVKLPPLQDKKPADKLNPYFEEEELMLGIAGNNSKELNYLIRNFDDQLDGFINQNFRRIYRKKEGSVGHEFAGKLKSEYQHTNNSFFRNYVEYRLGLLEFLANPQAFGKMENRYFKNRKVQFYNPAYTSLFKKLYGNFLTGYFDRKEGPAIRKAFANKNPYQNMTALLAKYESYQDENLRDMLLLCGLFDGYTRKFFSRNDLLSISQVMENRSAHPYNRTLAKNITKHLNHLRPGHPAPDFHLPGELASANLEHYKGKHLYLSFCNTQSYACQKDFEELEKLYQQFGKEVEFLTIATDWDPKTFEAFQKNHSYSWTLLHIGDQQHIAREYNVRAYPTYFLIDEKGNIVKAPAPGPKEHIEQDFIRIRRDAIRKAYRK
ncbi:MAG: peroxiredoxin family protein [Marinifilaceae bacterium]